jgi:hypothetical protein
MKTPAERLRERELARRRENELKDLEVEDTHAERPLEGLSSAGTTTWTPEQDESQRGRHEDDEAVSRARSLGQIPESPGRSKDED